MSFDLSTTALATAGVGGLMAFWGHIQGFFSRISSYVIVNTELTSDASVAVIAYMRKHYKVSTIGERRFTGYETFIRPKDRYGSVGFEMRGRSLIFFDRWKPIFVTSTVDRDGDYNGMLKLTNFRGLFDLDKLIKDSMEFYNKQMHEKRHEDSSRYQVIRHFGRSKFRGGDDEYGDVSKSPQRTRGGESPSSIPLDHLPIGWKRDELGSSISKVPFNNLAYSDSVLEFEQEVRHWKESEKWYKGKGLSWRFGAGLFGPPGTGKTSFVRAIAQDLDLPIHVFDLTTMNNQELTGFWKDALSAAPAIALFEDLDRLFNADRTLKGPKDGGTSITLDCLLNCINGVESADGLLVFVTANDISRLDTALGVPDETGKNTRPGRLDRAVYFGSLSEPSRVKIANRILSDCPQFIEQTVSEGNGDTGAQFESRCEKIAIREYWGGFKEYK